MMKAKSKHQQRTHSYQEHTHIRETSTQIYKDDQDSLQLHLTEVSEYLDVFFVEVQITIILSRNYWS